MGRQASHAAARHIAEFLSEPELVVAQSSGSPSVGTDALYYFAPTAAGGTPACSSGYTLFRAGIQPGSAPPVEVLQPPHACPSQVMADEDALYWTEDSGQVFRLPK